MFLERARDALGHPVEIVAGREEARLIYAGVSQSLPTEGGNRLVIDIGGGSTELIVGRGAEPLELESLNLGCVIVSQKHFADGKLSAKRFDRALLMARQFLEPVQEQFLKRGWESAAGSSGTVRAVLDSCREIDPKANVITSAGIEAIVETLCEAGHVDAIPFAAVTPDRRNVFAGGVVILRAVFAQLKIAQMRWSEGAMREGLLYDMIGRFGREDARERTVRSMQQRYHVDVAQAARVEATALKMLSQVQDSWKLTDLMAEQVLSWACGLHEIGLDVAHSGYHRHGAYLLANADMPGFAREEQLLLAQAGRQPSAQAGTGPAGRAVAALGRARHLPDPDPAAGGAAAPGSQRGAYPGFRADRQAEHTGAAAEDPLVPRASADGRGPQR